MASSKFISLVFLFVSLMAFPIAHAQGLIGGLLGGGGGGGGGGLLGGVSGLLGPVSGILGGGGLINISGNVSCSLDGSSGVVNGVATPSFPNAQVELQCGGNVVSNARTNSNGIFSMILNPLQNILPTLLSGCNIVVKTPLSTCNASLPSVGSLVSSLQFVGNIISGLLSITNIGANSFQFNQNLN